MGGGWGVFESGCVGVAGPPGGKVPWVIFLISARHLMNLFWFGLVCFYFFILVQTTGATLIEQIVYKRKLTFF